MKKKVYDRVEDIPKEGEEPKAEEPQVGPMVADPEPKEKPCKKKKPQVAPPHLPVGCTHD